MAESVLATRALVKRFPGVVALKGVSFDLRKGEIHALCGENGAGKSTLIKTLSGIHAYGTYEGEILVDGQPVAFRDIGDAETAGIGVIYQELAMVSELSVAENIALGREPRRHGLIDWLQMNSQARSLLAKFRIDLDPETRVGSLGIGQQQLVEIVRALGKESHILILDEPTAALSETEVELLLTILLDLKARGISCILITHKLGEVFAVADRITVIRDGESIITLDTAKTTHDELIRHMVGREIADLFPRQPATLGEPLLTVSDLDADPLGDDGIHLRDISFTVRAGEVLGIGGLMGAGRSELLLHIFGAWGRRRAGLVQLRGRELIRHSPHEAISRGLVMVTEDRKRLGLVLDQSISFNLSLSSLMRYARQGFLDAASEHTGNRGYFERLRIKAPHLEARVGGLSGGNQQKVVIGKALMTDPQVVFLDEPTRGIDVGAKQEVYHLINELTAAGKAVVLVSSELPELMGMSDRIIMLGDGRIGGTFLRGACTADQLLAAALHPHQSQPAESPHE